MRPRRRDQELLNVFAQNVREARIEAGYSQESFAPEVGLHRTYISHIERGAVNLSLANAVLVARGLGTTLYDLIAD